MKKYFVLGTILILSLFSCQKTSKTDKKSFSPEALAVEVTTQDGGKTTIKKILDNHKGNVVVLDFWASWCGDCLKALPDTKKLKANNPDVDFIYFSLDRKQNKWLQGLDKHGLSQNENYFFDQGWKNTFNNEIDLDWIPRLMVIAPDGSIALYESVNPNDEMIQSTINQLQEK